ncbi:hypothetical protein [Bradyrhizobium sp. DASA03120]
MVAIDNILAVPHGDESQRRRVVDLLVDVQDAASVRARPSRGLER